MISLIHIYVSSIYLNESHNINFENTVFNYLKNAVFFQYKCRQHKNRTKIIFCVYMCEHAAEHNTSAI